MQLENIELPIDQVQEFGDHWQVAELPYLAPL
jgi:hypothetical protein